MTRVSRSTTRNEIIQVACENFFERGYSSTSPKLIASELGISPGNLTYHFPTKEHLLMVVVQMLCEFQWKLLGIEAEKGIDSVDSVCLEMMTVAAACQEDEIARDFFTAAFQSKMCRDYLRNDHINRAKRIFADHCGDWTDEDFVQAELLIMGIQYITITADDSILPLKTRIRGALEYILNIYGIDEEIRQKE
ncbi:MAG: TetR/AcrR family transcriptional regulator, partial [Oscillospiraceae bacterium]|nr:TetR/AcrR family transcriptional regulator [Oscillospiraceae bacterium]